jgi:hypothetical protein
VSQTRQFLSGSVNYVVVETLVYRCVDFKQRSEF